MFSWIGDVAQAGAEMYILAHYSGVLLLGLALVAITIKSFRRFDLPADYRWVYVGVALAQTGVIVLAAVVALILIVQGH